MRLLVLIKLFDFQDILNDVNVVANNVNFVILKLFYFCASFNNTFGIPL